MSFNPISSKIPTSILLLEIHLMDWGDKQKAEYRFLVGDENGEVMDKRSGDLIPHLTSQQLQAIDNFMGEMRTLAEQSIQ